MMRSMYSGVSGLKAHQTRMDVIGNNIANVNTNGFKKSRVVFADTLYQNMRYGTAPADTRGGTNPMGVGLGSQVASVDQIHTSSPTTTTNNPTDMAISGNGYFMVKNGNDAYYSRAGAFQWDKSYNLVNSNGYMVQGWMANTNPAQATADGDFRITTSGNTVPININTFKQIAARATTSAIYSGNLDATYDIPQTTIAGVTGDINPVGSGKVTGGVGAATNTGTAGVETGAAVAAAGTDISAMTSPDFNIQIDGDATAHNIVLNPVGLTSGAAIAAAMQTGIRALGGAYANVTVNFNGATSRYTITSGSVGTSSAVLTTAGTAHDCTAALRLAGAAAHAAGTYSPGPNFNIQVDGDATVHNIALTNTNITGAAIAADMQTQIRAIGGAYANVTVNFDGTTNRYTITSGSGGSSSQVVITAGTADGTHTDVAAPFMLTAATGAVATNGSAQ